MGLSAEVRLAKYITEYTSLDPALLGPPPKARSDVTVHLFEADQSSGTRRTVVRSIPLYGRSHVHLIIYIATNTRSAPPPIF